MKRLFSIGFLVLILTAIPPTSALALSPSPASVDFGEVALGQSLSKSISVTNNGATAVTVDEVNITGINSSEFSIQSDGVSGQTIAPGAGRQVQVKYTPKTAVPAGEPDFVGEGWSGGIHYTPVEYGPNGLPISKTLVLDSDSLMNQGGTGQITYRIGLNGQETLETASVIGGKHYHVYIKDYYDNAGHEASYAWTVALPKNFSFSTNMFGPDPIVSRESWLVRQPDAKLSIQVNGSIDTSVPLFGVGKAASALPSVPTVTTPAFSTNQSPTPKFKVGWSADSADSYDVYYKIGLTGAWTPWKTGTTATSAYFTGEPGKTYYFKARAKKGGNTGDWSAVKSTVVPYNQSAMTYTGGWLTVDMLSMYRQSARYSPVKGAKATYEFKNARAIGLVVTRRPRGGKANVYIGANKIKTIDLYSPTIKYRQMVFIKSFDSPTSNTLRVVVPRAKNALSGGYRVEIDGVGVKR